MANIKDVARLAGVSISSVSNALNGTRYVSDALRDRVLQAVRTLDYAVDPIARSLKSSVTMTMGVVLTSINRVFFPQVLSGMQAAAERHKYSLLIYATNDDYEKEKQYVAMLAGQRVDGIILDSVAPPTDRAYYQHLAALRHNKKRIPVLSLERSLERHGIPSLYVDNAQGARVAVEHLLACGCGRILHIRGPQSAQMARHRLRGYRHALRGAGIAYDARLDVAGDFSPGSGYRATRHLLESATAFDGVFADNDQMAIGAIKALKERRLQIPGDVKVAGYDNTFVSSIVSPALTTIHVPKYEMGQEAVQMLCRQLALPPEEADGARATQHVKLATSLLVRESTNGSREENWAMEDW